MSEALNIGEELKAIRADLDFIKKHMVGTDSILSEDDYKDLQNYRKEKKEGKLVSQKQLKKELGL